MFYDKNLMNSRHLSKVWRVANNIEVSCDENINIPIICNNLDSWIASDDEEPYKRLSLRTSAVLVDGAAKLYKRKINQLYEDVVNLEYEMAFPKRMRFDGFTDISISPTFTENIQDVECEHQSDIETDCDINSTHNNDDDKASSSRPTSSQADTDCNTNSTRNNKNYKASRTSSNPSKADTDSKNNSPRIDNEDKTSSSSSYSNKAETDCDTNSSRNNKEAKSKSYSSTPVCNNNGTQNNKEDKASRSNSSTDESETECNTNIRNNNAKSSSSTQSEAEAGCITNNTHINNKNKASSSSSTSKAQAPRNSMADKSIQVSPNLKKRTFNEDLPFGHIIIYDNYKDRIPSRIMFSSINYNIHKFS